MQYRTHIKEVWEKMGVAAAQRASIYEKQLRVYGIRAQLRCQENPLAIENMATLLKIPDSDYAKVMARLVFELRIQWDAVKKEVDRLTPRELFHPLVSKFEVPLFLNQLQAKANRNSRTKEFQPFEEEQKDPAESLHKKEDKPELATLNNRISPLESSHDEGSQSEEEIETQPEKTKKAKTGVPPKHAKVVDKTSQEPTSAYPRNYAEVETWPRVSFRAGYSFWKEKKVFPCCLGQLKHRTWCEERLPMKTENSSTSHQKGKKRGKTETDEDEDMPRKKSSKKEKHAAKRQPESGSEPGGNSKANKAADKEAKRKQKQENRERSKK